MICPLIFIYLFVFMCFTPTQRNGNPQHSAACRRPSDIPVRFVWYITNLYQRLNMHIICIQKHLEISTVYFAMNFWLSITYRAMIYTTSKSRKQVKHKIMFHGEEGYRWGNSTWTIHGVFKCIAIKACQKPSWVSIASVIKVDIYACTEKTLSIKSCVLTFSHKW